MPRLYIPDIGDKLELTRAWEFPLHYESRNRPLGVALGVPLPRRAFNGEQIPADNGWWGPFKEDSTPVRLPKGTVLIVDRVYIRQGAAEYSSITFRSRIPGVKGKPRFWAKLADVNLIMFKHPQEAE